MRDVYLEEVAQLTVGHVGSMVDEYVDVGIPFLRSLNIQPHRIDFQETKFITRTFHEKLRKSALRPNDVVIVRTGKPGTCAVIPEDLVEANCSDLVIVRCGPHIRPRFLAYWVNAVASEHVASHIVGAVQQHFNVGSAKRMPIRLPSLRDQDNVLAILGTLDDKIELNRKTAATLEAMARALYRSWFVDFDPVRARAEGRAPAHMDAATAARFPDSFGEDGLPVGWRMGAVLDVFDVIMGQSPPGETYNENALGLPFYQGRAEFGYRFPTVKKYCSAPTRIARMDSTLLSVRAPVGDLNRAWEECCIGRGVAALWERSARNAYGYEAMQSLSTALASFDTEGTVFGSINKKQLANLPLIVPDDAVVDGFERLVAPMDQQIRSLVAQNRTLATLRDTLLPRLMSGELRVGAAREMVEEVA
ncbi:restriction endonuclease subunit S [Paracoccus laeviglucosivorans]|uniref:Type I restriction enzyme, S subunit n=1 Tax=Paracoccus laeviglucosivorans TaxID=1197861 RepID=A0A521DDQ9_9RHOB|nr:restriction endonuclease subunit S [Paracoccus laeviglucosivorans]SMO69783.1 type I restriction enzyme, S subunit [Paracoccus laeviglucosivorans]